MTSSLLGRVGGRVAVVTVVALAGLATGPGRGHAQVNAEALRPDPLRAGWSRSVDASLALSTGNIELLDVGGAVRVQRQTVRPAAGPAPALPYLAQRGLIVGSARYAERAGAPFVDQAFVHARWTAMWWRRLGSDVFTQYQRNQFLRLQGRAIAGVGVRVDVVHRPTVLVWGGAGYMFEHDRIAVAPGAVDAATSYEHRLTSYLTARVALADGRLLLQHTIYAQPRLDDPGDVRVLDEVEVLSRVSTVFALGTTVGVLHDSAPPTAVAATDVRLLSTVRASW